MEGEANEFKMWRINLSSEASPNIPAPYPFGLYESM